MTYLSISLWVIERDTRGILALEPLYERRDAVRETERKVFLKVSA